MSAVALLSRLERAGVTVRLKGDGLDAVGPRSALTDEVRAELRALKSEIVALLSDPESVRDRLLELAKAEEVSKTPVLALARADLVACLGESEDTLRAYVRALARTERMAKGLCPPRWTQASECGLCGPVWLAEGSPKRVNACPWCFHRVKGVTLPRPPVQCHGCRHFLPDAVNPDGAMGGCAVKPKAAEFPRAEHVCADYRSASEVPNGP